MSTLVLAERIERAILLIRGHKVLLDRDLAKLYGVETRNLNKAVNRNQGRFPSDFMIQLTRSEFNNLKFQFGTSSWGGTRKLPRAFTEQGGEPTGSVEGKQKRIPQYSCQRSVPCHIPMGGWQRARSASHRLSLSVRGTMRPKQRPPTHPGEILLKEFLEPMGISQMELAKALRVPVQRVNTLINGKRGVSAETALLLAHRLNTTPEFWMNLQTAWDLYEAAQGLRRASA
jgi:addiction module HigA family antidote